MTVKLQLNEGLMTKWVIFSCVNQEIDDSINEMKGKLTQSQEQIAQEAYTSILETEEAYIWNHHAIQYF